MVKRRNLLTGGIAAMGGAIASMQLHRWLRVDEYQATPTVAISTNTALPETATMPENILGKTGERIPILGLGTAGATPVDKYDRVAEATAVIERALELGIRYFDTAASYRASEENLGRVLPPYRDRVFLASKTASLDRDGAWRELERSLARLQTDYLDLWQLHHVSFADEIERMSQKDGAIAALEEAKEQGLIRYTGITGHHEPDVIVQGLRRYPFDMTLIPVNAADLHQPRPFISTVLPVAQELNVGVVAMKVPAYGRLLKPGVLAGMHEALGYTLSQPGVHSAVIAAETPEQLASNVAVAQAFTQLSEADCDAIARKVAPHWRENSFYRAWT
jgi:aryl-alcohol dehydrogenase-like predicted oxidoreductase